MGFICVGPGLNEFFFEIFIDRLVRSRRSGNGQDPILRASLPFIDIRATHIGEGVGNFLPWIDHDRVRSIHELVEAEFVKEVISFLLVSVEDWGFFPLEWFFIYSNWVRILRGLWWRSWRWCQGRRSSKRFLQGFRVRRCHSESTLCWEGPRKLATY